MAMIWKEIHAGSTDPLAHEDGDTESSTIVIGSDGLCYVCIVDHLSDNNNAPVTGFMWGSYWKLTSDTGYTAWQEGVSYTVVGGGSSVYKWRRVGRGTKIVTSSESKLVVSASDTKSLTYTLRADNLTHGVYEIRVTKLAADFDSYRYGDTVRLGSVLECYNNTLSYPRQALVGIQALASEQISGSIKFSSVVYGKLLRVYRADEVLGSDGYNYRCILSHTSDASTKPITGGSWATYWEQASSSAYPRDSRSEGVVWVTGTAYSATASWRIEYSNNPAWVAYDILTQPVLVDQWRAVSQTKVGDVVVPTTLNNHLYVCTAISGTGFTHSVEPVWITTNGNTQTDSEVTWQCLAGLTVDGVRRFDAYNPSYLVLSDFQSWADYCDVLVVNGNGSGGVERRSRFNGSFDSATNVWDSVLQVCQMSYACPVWTGTQIKIVIDQARESTQLFTIGNVIEDSFKEIFLSASERAGEIEVEFADEDKDYERVSLSVVDSTANRPSNKINKAFFGVTRASEAVRLAYRYLAYNKYQTRLIDFEADVDAIACEIGDRIDLSHDVPQWGTGGRVVSSTTTIVTIDRTFTIAVGTTGADYSLKIRLTNDSIVTKTLSAAMTPGDYTELTVSSAFSTGTPAQYDPYVVGLTATVVKPVIVIGIRKTSDQTVGITAVDYAAEVYAFDSGKVFTPAIDYSSLNRLVVISSVSAVEQVRIDLESGTIIRDIAIEFTTSTNAIYKNGIVRIYEETTTGWVSVAVLFTTTRQVIFTGAKPLTTYKIVVQGANSLNEYSPESVAGDANATTITTTDNVDFTSISNYRITGLQIFGQGNSTTFSGKDCKFVWNPITSVIQTDVGAGEENIGAGSSVPDLLVKDYKVEIWDTASGLIRRTEYVTITEYIYTYEKNREDGTSAAVAFEIRVTARDIFLNESQDARLSVTNGASDAVDTVDSVSVDFTGSDLILTWTNEEDLDFSHYVIVFNGYASAAAGLSLYSNPSEGTLTTVITGIYNALFGHDPDAAGLAYYIAGFNAGTFTAETLLINIIDGATGADRTASAMRKKVTRTKNYVYPISENIFDNDTADPTIVYSIQVVDVYGNFSVATIGTATNTAPSAISEINVAFTSPNLILSWTHTKESDFSYYSLVLNGVTKRVTDKNYTYTLAENIVDNTTADPSITYSLQVVDAFGQTSAAVSGTATNAAPSAISSITATGVMRGVSFNWSPTLETDISHFSYRLKVGSDDWGSWTTSQGTFIHRQLTDAEFTAQGQDVIIYIEIKVVDVFAQESTVTSANGTTLSLNVQATDIDDFAITASKIFTKIPIVSGDTWTDNSPSAGYVSWNQHTLYYNGAAYVIAAGNTNLKYIYWTGSTSYSTSNTNPGLTDSQFVIATNVSGAHDLAWNAIANQVIGSAYIQNLAVLDAHIESLSVTKLTAGTLQVSQYIQGGDRVFASGTGFYLGITALGVPQFAIGDATQYLTYSAGALTVTGDYKTHPSVGATQQGIHLSASNNELYFYGAANSGSGTISMVAAIGINTDGDDIFIGYFGNSTTSNRVGVGGKSYSTYGVYGRSVSEKGVYGVSDSNYGVFGLSTTGSGTGGYSIDGYGVYGTSVNSYGGFFGGTGIYVGGNIVVTGTVDGIDLFGSATNWNTAYTDRMKWDGGSTGLTAATGRTSLGVTATGSDTTYCYRSNNLSDVTASTARTNLGLGTIATQASDNVSITGGSITAITAFSSTDTSIDLGSSSGTNTLLLNGSSGASNAIDFTLTHAGTGKARLMIYGTTPDTYLDYGGTLNFRAGWNGTMKMTLDSSGNVYIVGDCSAQSFTDRTPFYSGDALSEIVKIKGKNGEIDHSTLPAFASRTVKKAIYQEVDGIDGKGRPRKDKVKIGEEDEPGRDLGAMISILTVAVQQLVERIEKLEKK